MESREAVGYATITIDGESYDVNLKGRANIEDMTDERTIGIIGNPSAILLPKELSGTLSIMESSKKWEEFLQDDRGYGMNMTNRISMLEPSAPDMRQDINKFLKRGRKW